MLNNFVDVYSYRIYRIAVKELSSLKRLPYNLIIGFVGDIFNKAKIPKKNPINKEYFEAIIDAIYEVIYNNIEPEFDSKEEYDAFNNILKTIRSDLFYAELIFSPRVNKYLYGNSPYFDQTIPFIINRQKVKNKLTEIRKYPDLNSELISYNTIYDLFP